MADPAEMLPLCDEDACDEAIAACDGDLRATIKALLIANEFLEQALADAQMAISTGYRRGRATKPKGS